MAAPALMPRPRMEERALTLDEWYALPDDGNLYELYQGVLILMAAPSLRHQDVLTRLSARCLAAADVQGGSVFSGPVAVGVSSDIGFLPDLVYVSNERAHIISGRGLEGIPDIVVEILSPSTRAFDRGTKLRVYLEGGAREVWLVDPHARTVFVATPAGERAAAFGEPIPSEILQVGDAGLGAFAS